MKTLRSISLFFVLAAAFAQTAATCMIYIEYQIRKDFIASEICKDRYVTINVCGGKCFIVDKFDEQQKRETEKKTNSITVIDLKTFFSTKVVSQSPNEQRFYETQIGYLIKYSPSEFFPDFFHPPRS